MKSSAAAAVGRSKAAEGFKVSMKKVRGSSSKESFKALPLVYRARGLVHEGAHARAETDRQRLASHGRRKIESYPTLYLGSAESFRPTDILVIG